MTFFISEVHIHFNNSAYLTHYNPTVDTRLENFRLFLEYLSFGEFYMIIFYLEKIFVKHICLHTCMYMELETSLWESVLPFQHVGLQEEFNSDSKHPQKTGRKD